MQRGEAIENKEHSRTVTSSWWQYSSVLCFLEPHPSTRKLACFKERTTFKFCHQPATDKHDDIHNLVEQETRLRDVWTQQLSCTIWLWLFSTTLWVVCLCLVMAAPHVALTHPRPQTRGHDSGGSLHSWPRATLYSLHSVSAIRFLTRVNGAGGQVGRRQGAEGARQHLQGFRPREQSLTTLHE